MATSIHTTTADASEPQAFIGRLGFDRLLSLLSCWFLGTFHRRMGAHAWEGG
ncbi:MAG: hypothetical protein PVSMB5_31440 [Ktedonobacteraceae bacterium]